MDQMGHSEQMSLSRSDGTRTLTLLRIHAGVSHKHEKQKAHIAGYKTEGTLSRVQAARYCASAVAALHRRQPAPARAKRCPWASIAKVAACASMR
jgi:hypothetical protein